MGEETRGAHLDRSKPPKPAIRALVEAALKSLITEDRRVGPQGREEWIRQLGRAVMWGVEIEHHKILASLMANGVSAEELCQGYIPETARYLGETWISDEASFVDVTTGASRLQALLRVHEDEPDARHVLSRHRPPGPSALMVVPPFEQHSLGAFVAAYGLRRLGIGVRMAIDTDEDEIAELIAANRFSMVGITTATWKSVEKAGCFIEYLRSNVERLPPVVIGGRVVEERAKIERRSGADLAIKSVREAVERCKLTAVVKSPSFDTVQ